MSKCSSEIINLINKVEPKIKSSLSQTSYSEKEDLEQSIKLKIIESASKIESIESPGFFEFKNKFKSK
ncbi:sigma factor regulatory protein rsoA [Oceanobacillus picturae]|uniref:Sigma factor regulatory protein rsoA n=1 Tax=Oceanobacillus picturae TaxID=171693 RepID=A0A0U9H686_9BACI|nr:hypothetical protein [Oceanobacillus picturae]GAQ18250.1 sigma factor regulatory protein rsoA [Oceanobacillus picturae]